MTHPDPPDDKKTFAGFTLDHSQQTQADATLADDEDITDPSIPPLTPSAHAQLDPTRFQVEGLIGVGGMGEVERIADRLLGRHIARKRVKEELIESTSVCRFFRFPIDSGIAPAHRGNGERVRNLRFASIALRGRYAFWNRITHPRGHNRPSSAL